MILPKAKDVMDEAKKWLFNYFLDWQKKQGEIKDQAEFARYLGVAKSTLSSWLSGTRKPSRNVVEKIYEITQDPTIYDACGYKRPKTDPIIDELVSIVEQLSSRDLREVLSFAKQKLV